MARASAPSPAHATESLGIVFMVSEATPLAKTGGLADVAGALPKALVALGHRVTVILPYYRRQIVASGYSPQRQEGDIHIWIDGRHLYAGIHRLEIEGVRYLLVEEDSLFDREQLYGPPGGAFSDNLFRYLFFSRVALELAAQLPSGVDIIHCHDWQTALVPLLLRSQYRHHSSLSKVRTLYTIHNLAYQGVFPPEWVDRLGLPFDAFAPEGFEFYGQINCMKAGIVYADAVTTVSRSYAAEILTPEYGWHLEGLLAYHSGKLSGIENGLDLEEWNPAVDPYLPARFGVDDPVGKRRCKEELQRRSGLSVREDQPLMAVVSRLAEQKGIDLLFAAIHHWLHQGCQLVVLGAGDPGMEHALAHIAATHPEQFCFHRGYNEPLAHLIYAGADLFLMPSRFEPCGLSQLVAMRYGAVPVVRATGGLRDTVVDYRHSRSGSTGFSFEEASSDALRECVDAAVDLWRRPNSWRPLRNRALRRDSSWQASAQLYVELYRKLFA